MCYIFWLWCILFQWWMFCSFVGHVIANSVVGTLLSTTEWLLVGFQHETELLEDSLALSGFPPFSCKFGSSEEEYVDSDELENSRPHARPPAIQNPPLTDSNLVTIPSGSMKQDFRRRPIPQGWLHKMVRQKLFLFSFLWNPLLPTSLIPLLPPPSCQWGDNPEVIAEKSLSV